ncbi:hypothetical protein M422DRAFT_256614 [Sphaerobolus stellatus SS14]|uniref:Uncharacterized protein n=1 Tax=Sphaerobolus stellatus (strain SS14) TaxID=990650 RepID=A0A0C9VG44_SPHS4|nr:hypothetical protein M422DRAFT_270792 [Sphaerobolus stellatus SS14]KIJ40382.1 hypothetical protein M422DRAFT_256614 [Sphaerobolus stellatus SS14]
MSKDNLKHKRMGKKLVFDDKGNPHELHLMDDEEFRGNLLEESKRFAETDVMDKEEAREEETEGAREDAGE